MNFIVLDTETTNGFDDPLVYDCGWSVINDKEEVLCERSFVNADVFLAEKELMETAYYADKIPQYEADLKSKNRVLAKFSTIRWNLHRDCKNFHVVGIMAHNARFDYNALQTTQRFLTKSKYRWFFPYGVEILDTLKGSRLALGNDEEYKRFCIENGFTLANGKTPRFTAEVLYRFISNNTEFEEKHCGLEDTQIEREIFWKCLEKGVSFKDMKMWDMKMWA